MGSIVGRVLAVAGVLVIGLPVSDTVLAPWLGGAPHPATEGGVALLALGLSDALLVVLLAAGARIRGPALVGALALLLWASAAGMPQLDAALFPAASAARPDGYLLAALVQWGTLALACAWIAAGAAPTPPVRAADPVDPVRFTVVALLYPVIWLVVAWLLASEVPVVRALHGNASPGAFWDWLGDLVTRTPLVLPYQIVRGMLWTGLAVLVTRVVRYGTLATAVYTGLVLALPMAFELLRAESLVPVASRLGALLEAGSATLLFGLIAGLLLADAPFGAVHRRELPA